jgi:hypothetical protein
MIERMSNKYPFNRLNSVLDISLMLIFLTPEQSIWINLQDFSVDGRMSRI